MGAEAVTLLWQLIAPFAGYLAAAGLALVAWFGNGALQRRKGRKAAEAEAKAKVARDTIATRERIDNAVSKLDPVDADAARDRLRKRKP